MSTQNNKSSANNNPIKIANNNSFVNNNASANNISSNKTKKKSPLSSLSEMTKSLIIDSPKISSTQLKGEKQGEKKETEEQQYKSNLFDIDFDKITGVYPVMLNVNKIMSILRSDKVKVTPKNSFKLLGEYVNRYNAIDESDEEKIESHKNLLKLNNDFDTIIETIQLFSKSGSITPKLFIDVINNLVLHYNESNKEEVFMHYAYLAEIIYAHFSILMSNKELSRNEFFENDIALNINAIKECAEFYYTDIYLLNSDEKRDMINTLKSYYLENILTIKKDDNNANLMGNQMAKQLEANTAEYKKQKAIELEEKKKAKKEEKKAEKEKYIKARQELMKRNKTNIKK